MCDLTFLLWCVVTFGLSGVICNTLLSFSGVIIVFLFGYMCVCFFFFKQKTAYEMRISDWSSDVCSSDLGGAFKRDLQLLLQRGVVDVGEYRRHVLAVELGEAAKAVDAQCDESLRHRRFQVRADLRRRGRHCIGVGDERRQALRQGRVRPRQIDARIKRAGIERWVAMRLIGDRKSTRLNSSH